MADNEQQFTTQPYIPSEEALKSGAFDKIPKDEVRLAEEKHHRAAPGPAMPKEGVPAPKSRDELHAQAEALNKPSGK